MEGVKHMEKKVIYRNKQNGKVGTLVRKNDRFKQVILEVEGKNVPYSSSTIKRWWEVVDEKEVAPQATDNKEESTSVSEPKAPVSENEIADVSQANAKAKVPKKQSKKNSLTSKTTGPDMEVFSYIKQCGASHSLSEIEVAHHKDRTIVLGKQIEGGVRYRRNIKFYVGNDTIRVSMKDTPDNRTWLEFNSYKFKVQSNPRQLITTIDIKDYKAAENFIQQTL